MEPHKLVIIGCSALGLETVSYVCPDINIENASVVVVPHIENNKIYRELLGYDLQVYGTNDGVVLERGKFYVYAHEHDDMSNDFPYLHIDGTTLNQNAQRNQDVDSIDEAMKSASSWGEHCIGVVLAGGGDDGGEGARQIKISGGYVIVQERVDPYHWPGGYMPEEVQKRVTVDYVGNLDGIIKELNRRLA